jgi:hypothetical protein
MQDDTLKPNHSEAVTNQKSWWGKLIAVIAVANLLLVLFNFSYIPLRDVYLHKLPVLVEKYDPIRSIEPNPDTTRYLNTVNSLKQEISKTGLESPSTKEIFADLRQQSADMLVENPFSVANKFATFAKLKRRMEYQVNTLSAQEAFTQFWTPEYFSQVTPTKAFSFFDRKIGPLMEVNYLRTVDENGQFVDEFWRIDLFFGIFFALELLIRSFVTAQKQSGVSWGDVILRRWYDGLMVLPTWRWLRIIPVSVRLHQSGLINLERILAQITHEPAAYLADRTSVFLLVRLINQTKEAVETGAAARALLEPQDYIQVSDVNKLDAISDRILELSIYKVLPEVQPDVEILLRHSLREALQQSDFYQGLQKLPGLDVLPVDVTEQLADYLAQSVYEILLNSYSDAEGRELFENLAQNFKKTLSQELRNEETQSELQLLLSQLLEELKLNYVQNSQDKDATETMSEAEQLELRIQNSELRS